MSITSPSMNQNMANIPNPASEACEKRSAPYTTSIKTMLKRLQTRPREHVKLGALQMP